MVEVSGAGEVSTTIGVLLAVASTTGVLLATSTTGEVEDAETSTTGGVEDAPVPTLPSPWAEVPSGLAVPPAAAVGAWPSTEAPAGKHVPLTETSAPFFICTQYGAWVLVS